MLVYRKVLIFIVVLAATIGGAYVYQETREADSVFPGSPQIVE